MHLKNGRNIALFIGIAIAALVLFSLPFLSAANGNQPPNADFHWNPTGTIQTGQAVQFLDDSTDSDGNIIAWEWDFDDGTYSIKQEPSHTYQDDGTYSVELTVIDNNGSTDSVTKQITVTNRPPIADAGPSQEVNSSVVSFDGRGSSDPDGSIAAYEWNFGDGNSGTGATPDHTYDEDGDYTVTLNVTDNDGAYDTDATQVTVDTIPPTTNATINGTEGSNGWYTSNVTVTLDATDNTTGVDDIYYKIDDGNWTRYQGPITLTKEGNRTVRFYSEDNVGNKENTSNITIKIDTSPPTVTLTTPDEGYIYLFGQRLLPTLRGNTYIFGRITAEATVTAAPSGVDKVRFLIDGNVEYTDFEEPYSWQWGRALGGHNLGIKAIDTAGQNTTVEQYVTIFSLLPGRSDATIDNLTPAETPENGATASS